MRLLFRIAFKNHKHKILLLLTVVAMCMLTLATQLEIFSLGVITKKGPDFFELFAPFKDGKLERTDIVNKDIVNERWDEVDTDHKGYITKAEASAYLVKW